MIAAPLRLEQLGDRLVWHISGLLLIFSPPVRQFLYGLLGDFLAVCEVDFEFLHVILLVGDEYEFLAVKLEHAVKRLF